MHASDIQWTDNWIWLAPKVAGANTGGEYSGWYRDTPRTAISCSNKIPHGGYFSAIKLITIKIFAKWLRANYYGLINADDPDSFADAFFAVRPRHNHAVIPLPNPTGDDICVASIAVGGKIHASKDLYRDAYQAYMTEPRFKPFYRTIPRPHHIPTSRPRFAGTFNKEPMRTVILSNRYQNMPRIRAGGAILEAPDGHFENLRAVDIQNDPLHKKVVRIDLGDALKKF